ncbi:MAG: DUF4435 domain-containing protein [Rikenellaceae bacterium]
MARKAFKNFITSSYIDAASHISRPQDRDVRRVMVYVEGYEDIPFWREILSELESSKLQFEVNVPSRDDMAKGKRVLMSMAQNAGRNLILCMDSDFDYLFQGKTPQSQQILSNKFIVHTYAYSIENLLCYAPSLKRIVVRASKNDRYLLDINKLIESFSSVIYPLFLWYAYSALSQEKHIFVLADFRNAIRVNFLDTRNEGVSTLNWLKRGVMRKLHSLEERYPLLIPKVKEFAEEVKLLGVTRENCYIYINGHALMDNICTILNSIVDTLREEKMTIIRNSSIKGATLSGEMSNYKNSLMKVSDLLKNNTGYKDSPLYPLIIERLKEVINDIDKE